MSGAMGQSLRISQYPMQQSSHQQEAFFVQQQQQQQQQQQAPLAGGLQNMLRTPLMAATGIPGGGLLGTPTATSAGSSTSSGEVLDVWKWNLEEQMLLLNSINQHYNYISIDCRFPGIVARPIGSFKSTAEYHYQTLRANVDILQVIQIGISLSDEYGNQPPMGVKTWQFNFHFDINNDMFSSEGIKLLKQTGVDFNKHEKEGIDPFAFGEFILSSGLVLNKQNNWITFHSGYDLGYLMSIMLNQGVPVEESMYLKQLHLYFPNIYDVKFLVRAFHLSQRNQLLDIAEEFQVVRPGTAASAGLNQAGADAFIALSCFFEMKRIIGEAEITGLKDNLFGLGKSSEEGEEEAASTGSEVGSGNGEGVSSVSTPVRPSAVNVFQYGKMGAGGH